MNRTRLYIENQEVELTEDVQFLINKQFEDLTNPTVIINDWSKTVQIPATQNNDRLFGHCYRTDRLPSVVDEKDIDNKLTGVPVWEYKGFGGGVFDYNTVNFSQPAYIWYGNNTFNHLVIDLVNLTVKYALQPDGTYQKTYSYKSIETLSNNINREGVYPFQFTYKTGMNCIRIQTANTSNTRTGNAIYLKLDENRFVNNEYYTFILNLNNYKIYNPLFYKLENNQIVYKDNLPIVDLDESLFDYDLGTDTYTAKSDTYIPDDTLLYRNTTTDKLYTAKVFYTPARLINANPIYLTGNELYGVDMSFSVENTNKPIGVRFDPYKKLSFQLTWNDSLFMTGYAKMSRIVRNDTNTYYEINLCGSLGDLFQEMKKITFNTKLLEEKGENGEDMSEYVIDTTGYGVCAITKDLVYDCWTREPIDVITGETTDLLDVIGFAPNNSFNKDFKYDSVCFSDGKIVKLAEALGDSFKTATGVDPDTVIGNGLLPRGFGDFRSYNQLTYIYFKKLWDIFKGKAESVTGYKFVEDPNWFNIDNPYFSQMVMLLNPPSEIIIKDGTDKGAFSGRLEDAQITTSVKNYYIWGNKYADGYEYTAWYGAELINEKTSDYITEPSMTPTPGTLQGNAVGTFKINESEYSLYINPMFAFSSDIDRLWGTEKRVTVQYVVCDDNETPLSQKIPLIEFIGEGAEPTPGYVHNITMPYYAQVIPGEFRDDINYWTHQVEQLPISTDTLDYTGNVKIKFYIKFYGFYDIYMRMSPILWNPADGLTYDGVGYTVNRVIRSNKAISIESIWNNSANIFDVILNYCKAHRIVVWTDDNKKEIHFQTCANFFYDGMFDRNGFIEPTDWSNKVDYSKEFTIKPITWDSKYVKFNYADTDDAINENYKDKYGYNFGELRVNTHYNFNDETKELFDNNKISIISTDTIYDWNKLTEYSIVNSIGLEEFVHTKDEDDKFKKNFGTFTFINKTLNNFDTTLRNVRLTDDTTFMLQKSVYCYIGNYPGETELPQQRRVYTYPGLTNVVDNKVYYNGYIWQTFAVPMKSYSYITHTLDNASALYYFLWENYINERYDERNKIVTCYIYLTPNEMVNFKFNKYIKIDGQIYTVNKIFDYNISGNAPTKVELITVQNPPKLFTSNLASFKLQSVQGHTLEDGVIAIESAGYPYVIPSSGVAPDLNYLSSKFDFSNVTPDAEIPTRWYVSAKLKDTATFNYNESIGDNPKGISFYANIGNNLGVSRDNEIISWDVKFNWQRVVRTFTNGNQIRFSINISFWEDMPISTDYLQYLNEDGTVCDWLINPLFSKTSDTTGQFLTTVLRNDSYYERTAYIVYSYDNIDYRLKIVQAALSTDFSIIGYKTALPQIWDNPLTYKGLIPSDFSISIDGVELDSSYWWVENDRTIKYVAQPDGQAYLGRQMTVNCSWTDEQSQPRTLSFLATIGGDFCFPTATGYADATTTEYSLTVDVDDYYRDAVWSLTTDADWIEGLYYIDEDNDTRINMQLQQNTTGEDRETFIYASRRGQSTIYKMKLIQRG